MNTYKVLYHHGNIRGLNITNAITTEAAAHNIMALHNIPEHSIKEVTQTHKTIYVVLYSTIGMRERHFEDENEAMRFALEVKGAVCPIKVKIKPNLITNKKS